jgi:hypothetical protein
MRSQSRPSRVTISPPEKASPLVRKLRGNPISAEASNRQQGAISAAPTAEIGSNKKAIKQTNTCKDLFIFH